MSKKEIFVDITKPLKNRQHETYCQYIAQGKTKTEAYMKTYNAKKKQAGKNFTSLEHRNPAIRERIDYLIENILKELNITTKRVIAEKAKIAFCDIGNLLEWGNEEVLNEETGNITYLPYVKFKNSSEIDTSVVSEVGLGKNGINLKIFDKQKELNYFGRMLDIQDNKRKKEIEERKIRLQEIKAEQIERALEKIQPVTLVDNIADALEKYAEEEENGAD